MVENDGVKKPMVWGYVWALALIIVALLVFILLGKPDVVAPKCDLNSSFNSGLSVGYNEGVGIGVNGTVQSLLKYSSNCSIASMNVSGNIYGFVDVTCLTSQDGVNKIISQLSPKVVSNGS